MTLTKQDLSAITGIIQVETGKVVKSELAPVNVRLTSIDKRLTKVEKDLTKTINFFDKEHLNLKKRVEKTEFELGIPAPEF